MKLRKIAPVLPERSIAKNSVRPERSVAESKDAPSPGIIQSFLVYSQITLEPGVYRRSSSGVKVDFEAREKARPQGSSTLDYVSAAKSGWVLRTWCPAATGRIILLAKKATARNAAMANMVGL